MAKRKIKTLLIYIDDKRLSLELPDEEDALVLAEKISLALRKTIKVINAEGKEVAVLLYPPGASPAAWWNV
jgi:hypothetical protein